MKLQICITTLVLLGIWLDPCDARPGRHHRHRNDHIEGERGPAGRRHRERGPAGGRDMPMPTPGSDEMDMNEIMNYFQRYHYMGSNVPDPAIANLMETNMSMAVQEGCRLFQRRYARYGLRETGELDADTINLMRRDRCGVADLMTMGDMMMRRKKRYALAGSKWNKNNITYNILRYPSTRNHEGSLYWREVDSEIEKAFQVWERVTPLSFHKLPYGSPIEADIRIEFGAYDHGDSYPFDGPGGVLAHAFFPSEHPIAGDSHFDDDEEFTIHIDSGYNLFTVAAHEFGHALGLGHSQDPSALMAPFYGGYKPEFYRTLQLPMDDVMGIQAKYGGPTRPVEPTNTPRPGMPEDENICEDASFDAITTVLEAGLYKTYGFKGRYYFLIDPRTGGIAQSYPRLISEGWPGLPDNIDAALFWDEGNEWKWDKVNKEWNRNPPAKTFVFKGYEYWEVTDMGVSGGPKPISNWGLTQPIDAAFEWRKNGDTYFIIGNQMYRYNRGSNSMVPGYPIPVSQWGDLPHNIDAAFQHTNRQTYFFSGSQFWAYDDFNERIERGYPRDSNGYWFRC